MNNNEVKLKLAIQKSGRLYEDSIRLLKECGIDISNGVNKLKADAMNFPQSNVSRLCTCIPINNFSFLLNKQKI